MKRIIVDYKRLTPEMLNLLVKKFPDGYGIRDIVHFTNHKGKYIDAVEVKAKDTIYLVKISEELIDCMESHNTSVSAEIDKEIDLDDDK